MKKKKLKTKRIMSKNKRLSNIKKYKFNHNYMKTEFLNKYTIMIIMIAMFPQLNTVNQISLAQIILLLCMGLRMETLKTMKVNNTKNLKLVRIKLT